MSRIVTFETYGAPEVLQFRDIDVPAPAAREVRIAVRAIGLNRAESMWRNGHYVEEVRLPARLGYEVAGTVDAVGSEVTHVRPGDRVTTIPSFSQNDYGLYGELVNAPAHAVVAIPAGLSFEEATAIWNPYITPYGAFAERQTLGNDDVVLVSSASSSVGLGAIEMINMLGATPVALTRTNAKRDALLAAGAKHVIATAEQDLVAEVMRITGGKGATFAFEAVGGSQFPTLLASLAHGATVFVYGALSDEVTPLPLLDIIPNEPVIRGYNLFGTTTDPERQARAVAFIAAGLASGQLKPRIAQTFAFDDIVEAHRTLEKNEHIGRIVVTV
jgi:NADPH:quinone reductase-like Zn-dependent oxidoreductase